MRLLPGHVCTIRMLAIRGRRGELNTNPTATHPHGRLVVSGERYEALAAPFVLRSHVRLRVRG